MFRHVSGTPSICFETISLSNLSTNMNCFLSLAPIIRLVSTAAVPHQNILKLSPDRPVPELITKDNQEPIARRCIAPGVVCLNQNAANLPYPFYRQSPNGTAFTNYGDTDVPGDPSWQAVSTADFLVFDERRAREVLGHSPSVEFAFPVNPFALHEAPTFVPSLNRVYFSELSPSLSQFIIDLNQELPTLSEFVADPPIYVPMVDSTMTARSTILSLGAASPFLGEARRDQESLPSIR